MCYAYNNVHDKITVFLTKSAINVGYLIITSYYSIQMYVNSFNLLLYYFCLLK